MSDLDREMQDMSEPTRAPATWWKPEPGEYVVGHIVSIVEEEGDYGLQKVIRIRDRSGETWARRINGSLAGELEANSVAIGDLVGLKYLDEAVAVKSGRSYKRFGIRVFERSKRNDETQQRNKPQQTATGDEVDDFADDIPF